MGIIMRRIIIGFICSLIIAVNVCAASDTTYGPTTSSDNVWDIAIEIRPSEEVSIYQVMLAIFNLNKRAFYYDNINALDTGKIIKLPDIKAIRSVAKKDAYDEIARQDRQWQQGIKKSLRSKDKIVIKEKNKLDKQLQNLTAQTKLIPPTDNSPANTTSQPVNSQPQEAQATAAPQAQGGANVVVGAAGVEDAAIKELTTRLAAAEEKNNLTQTQVAQIGGRVESIEKSVRELTEFEKKVSACFSSKFFMWLQQYADQLSDFLGPQLFMVVIAIIILVLFILLVYLIIPRRKCICAAYPQDDSREGDFNRRVESGEDVASKLNLARAYIEMGEENKAQTLLHEVLSHGSDSEQEEAKTLLDKMKADRF